MKLGFHIPNLSPASGPEGIVKVAQKAEELGYETIWSTERLLWPVNPRTGYGGMEGVPLPEGNSARTGAMSAIGTRSTRSPWIAVITSDRPSVAASIAAKN